MDYRFATVWTVEAPLPPVFDAICQSLEWPQWWTCVEAVRELAPGEPGGVGNVRRYVWKGWLPYRLDFDIRVTRIEPQVAIDGLASGDVEGCGRWSFAHEGGATRVRHDWRVRIASPGLRLLAGLAGPLVRGNHDYVMACGGQGLARRLDARLVACSHQ